MIIEHIIPYGVMIGVVILGMVGKSIKSESVIPSLVFSFVGILVFTVVGFVEFEVLLLSFIMLVILGVSGEW